MTIVLRIVLAAALVAIAAPARADESPDEVGVPMPEPTESVDQATANEQPVTAPMPTGTPSYVTDEEPIEAVHRPKGFWGVVAVAADVLVMRPIGLISLAPAAAAAVMVSPVTAATQTFPDAAGALQDRAKDVFTRPLGAL
jgi:hypothetical protein